MRIDKTRNTGTRNAIPGMGGMLYSGGMSPNILGNVSKHSRQCPKHFRQCRQTFPGISPNILGNVVKYSGEMSSNIPRNVAKHSGEYVLKHSEKFCQTFWGILRIFGVKEDNYWAEPHLESC